MKTFIFSNSLLNCYRNYHIDDFKSRHFQPEFLHKLLDKVVIQSNNLIKSQIIGQSFMGRPIRIFNIGKGPITILLWSQMHGDEPTGTIAMMEILNYLAQTQSLEETSLLLSKCTLFFLPMLNPDGAAVFQRRTAQGIDMNRDAIALCTPEARILKNIHQKIKPQFALNLHDQELSSVGNNKEITAIALLVPAKDEEKIPDEIVLRAKMVTDILTRVLKLIIPNNLAKYDDAYEPRAFGDYMQSNGTSTILIESGHWLDDPEKSFVRKLNFVGILSTLYAIAVGEYKSADHTQYDSLPLNGKKAFDLIIRNVLIDHGNNISTPADIAISYQVDSHTEPPPKLIDMGDLHTFVGLKEIEGKKKLIPQSILKIGGVFNWENYFY